MFYFWDKLTIMVGIKRIDYKVMLDLLIREVDGAWWSEGCLFSLNMEENDILEKYIKEYNKDSHLKLLCKELK